MAKRKTKNDFQRVYDSGLEEFRAFKGSMSQIKEKDKATTHKQERAIQED